MCSLGQVIPAIALVDRRGRAHGASLFQQILRGSSELKGIFHATAVANTARMISGTYMTRGDS